MLSALALAISSGGASAVMALSPDWTAVAVMVFGQLLTVGTLIWTITGGATKQAADKAAASAKSSSEAAASVMAVSVEVGRLAGEVARVAAEVGKHSEKLERHLIEDAGLHGRLTEAIETMARVQEGYQRQLTNVVAGIVSVDTGPVTLPRTRRTR